jgi:hypothetical protein
VAQARGQFGNPERKRPPFGAVAEDWRRATDREDPARSGVNFRVRNSDRATVNDTYGLCPINPATQCKPRPWPGLYVYTSSFVIGYFRRAVREVRMYTAVSS